MTMMRTDRLDVRRRLAALVTGAAVSMLPVRAVAQSAPAMSPVTVRLARPAVVGQRRHVEIDGEHHSTTRLTVGGQLVPQAPEDRRAHLVAVSRVLAVDARGSVTREEYTIERFEDHGPAPLVMSHGQVLVVERGDTPEHATVTLDGHPLTEPQRHSVETVMSITVSAVTDDDAFGTTQPQVVGATWPMHAEVAAADLARIGITATLAGQAHLVRRRMDHGVDAIEVAAEMTGNVTAVASMPPGAAIRRGSVRATMGSVVPAAPVGPVHSSETRMHMDVVMAFEAQGQPGEVVLRADDTTRGTFSAL